MHEAEIGRECTARMLVGLFLPQALLVRSTLEV